MSPGHVSRATLRSMVREAGGSPPRMATPCTTQRGSLYARRPGRTRRIGPRPRGLPCPCGTQHGAHRRCRCRSAIRLCAPQARSARTCSAAAGTRRPALGQALDERCGNAPRASPASPLPYCVKSVRGITESFVTHSPRSSRSIRVPRSINATARVSFRAPSPAPPRPSPCR